MGRAWDILPPQKKPKAKTKRKSNNALSLFFFIVICLVIFFIFAATQNIPTGMDGIATVSPNKTPKIEISTPIKTKSKNDLLIKVLNGSGKGEETSAVSDILTNIDFTVTKTENALNLYDQTIIYYEINQEKYAQEIAQNLSKYNAKIQQFSQDSPYDLIVVIGAR